jgi:hypothetical protein
MNAVMKEAPRSAQLSYNLIDYKLTHRHKSILKRFDDLCRYMRLANKMPPCMRLSRADYADINAAVVKQSDNQRSLGTVRYGTFAILSAGE